MTSLVLYDDMLLLNKNIDFVYMHVLKISIMAFQQNVSKHND